MEVRGKIKQAKGSIMTTNLVDQELELDNSSTALMLTVTLHASTAKAVRSLSQRKCVRNSKVDEFFSKDHRCYKVFLNSGCFYSKDR